MDLGWSDRIQEVIGFIIGSEMLVSLNFCEILELNQCVFLIGCERYSSYEGYSDSFKFDDLYYNSTSK